MRASHSQIFLAIVLFAMIALSASGQSRDEMEKKKHSLAEELAIYEAGASRFTFNYREAFTAFGPTLGPKFPASQTIESSQIVQDEMFRTEVTTTSIFTDGTDFVHDDIFTYDGEQTRSLAQGHTGNVRWGTKRPGPTTVLDLYLELSSSSRLAKGSLSEFIADPSGSDLYSEYKGIIQRDGESLHWFSFTSYDPANPEVRTEAFGGDQVRVDKYLNAAPGLWPAGNVYTTLNSALEATDEGSERWATEWTDIGGLRVAMHYEQEGYNSRGGNLRTYTLTNLEFEANFPREYFGLVFPPIATVYIIDPMGELISEVADPFLGLLDDLDTNLDELIEDHEERVVEVEDRRAAALAEEQETVEPPQENSTPQEEQGQSRFEILTPTNIIIVVAVSLIVGILVATIVSQTRRVNTK